MVAREVVETTLSLRCPAIMLCATKGGVKMIKALVYRETVGWGESGT